MCNLNVIVKSKIKDRIIKSLPAFLMGVTKSSYNFNSDGDGIYLDNKNKLFKGKKKVNVYKFEDDIYKSNFIITHQRIATSGFDAKYSQPFMDNDFVIAHNGVITELSTISKSDTFVFFKQFTKKFKLLEGEREFKIIESIKSVVENLEGYGSYSIVIFDKKTKILYYFKNNGTFIHFYTGHNILYITTSINNDILLKTLDINFNEMEKIENNIIYRICIKDDKIDIKTLSKIKPKERSYYNDNFNEFERNYYNDSDALRYYMNH